MNDDYFMSLFVGNVNLIYKFARNKKKYWFLFDSVEDMIQELSLALWVRIKCYNNKYAFSTFVNLIFINYCKKKVGKYFKKKEKYNISITNETSLNIDDKNLLDNMPEDVDIFEQIENREELSKMTSSSIDIINGYSFNETKKRNHIGINKLYAELEKDKKRILKMKEREESIWK